MSLFMPLDFIEQNIIGLIDAPARDGQVSWSLMSRSVDSVIRGDPARRVAGEQFGTLPEDGKFDAVVAAAISGPTVWMTRATRQAPVSWRWPVVVETAN